MDILLLSRTQLISVAAATNQLKTAQKRTSSCVYLVAIKATLLFSEGQTSTRHELLVLEYTTVRYGKQTG